MGLCGGPIFGATFCAQFGLIMTSAARTKRKKCDPKKLKLFALQRNASLDCVDCFSPKPLLQGLWLSLTPPIFGRERQSGVGRVQKLDFHG